MCRAAAPAQHGNRTKVSAAMFGSLPACGTAGHETGAGGSHPSMAGRTVSVCPALPRPFFTHGAAWQCLPGMLSVGRFQKVFLFSLAHTQHCPACCVIYFSTPVLIHARRHDHSRVTRRPAPLDSRVRTRRGRRGGRCLVSVVAVAAPHPDAEALDEERSIAGGRLDAGRANALHARRHIADDQEVAILPQWKSLRPAHVSQAVQTSWGVLWAPNAVSEAVARDVDVICTLPGRASVPDALRTFGQGAHGSPMPFRDAASVPCGARAGMRACDWWVVCEFLGAPNGGEAYNTRYMLRKLVDVARPCLEFGVMRNMWRALGLRGAHACIRVAVCVRAYGAVRASPGRPIEMTTIAPCAPAPARGATGVGMAWWRTHTTGVERASCPLKHVVAKSCRVCGSDQVSPADFDAWVHGERGRGRRQLRRGSGGVAAEGWDGRGRSSAHLRYASEQPFYHKRVPVSTRTLLPMACCPLI